MVLLDCLDLLEVRERFNQQRRAERGESRREADRILSRSDLRRTHRQDRAVVELLVHAHDRDARLGITGKNRGRDRGRASMSRQQRRMYVDRTALRDRQHRARNDLPVRDDDKQIGLQLLQPFDRLRVANSLRLVHLQAEHLRGHLDRWRRELHAPAGGSIRLRDHQLDVVARVDQSLEGRYGELGRAGEDDLQEGGYPAAAATSSSTRRSVSRLVNLSVKRTPSR